MQTKSSPGKENMQPSSADNDNFLQLSQLTKKFGDVTAVDDVDITIKRGEFFALLGPSGCGKTTTMRCIAGFEEPTDGDILVEGKSITGLHPSQRNTGMVFQNYALFPHYDVYRNVAYGLIMDDLKGPNRFRALTNLLSGRSARKNAELRNRVEEALAQVQLAGYENRKITELSGGQQQRVALARALIKRPSLLLMDEPLSNLDAGLRNEMRVVIRDIQQEVGITTVFVTHDQEEAMSMADRVALMKEGAIVQCTTPEKLYERPVNAWAATFVGKSNLLQGTIKSSSGGLTEVDIAGTSLVTQDQRNGQEGQTCTVMIRPEDLVIAGTGNGNGPSTEAGVNKFNATVQRSTFFGGEVIYELESPFGTIEIERPFSGEGSISPLGTTVELHVNADRVHILDEINGGGTRHDD